MPTLNFYLADVELTAFEQFIQWFSILTTFWDTYSTFLFALYGLEVLVVWVIFSYHIHVLQDHNFFMKNLVVTSRFTVKTYDLFRWLSTVFAPFGFFIIVYSAFTNFSSVKFLKLFGTKRLKTDF